MKNRGTVIIGGFIGVLPAGGVTWDYIQYVLGFKKMGFEVVYLEDTRLYPIYQKANERWDDSAPIIANLKNIMNRFDLANNWIYRDEVTGKSFGMDLQDFKETCRRADFFVNISCSTVMRDEYAQIPNRILIDSDPMFTQIQLKTGQSFTEENSSMLSLVAAHNHHFTFAENIKDERCLIPNTGFNFLPTRQPIVLNLWPVTQIHDKGPFTTLMNYSLGKTLTYEGQRWGQKDIEFQKIKRLPEQFNDEKFEIVVTKTEGSLTPSERAIFLDHEWKLIYPDDASRDEKVYQRFIQSSKGEISVAKHTYVKANTGWFSCRSACYLASGRPVIAQDTGWSKYYTTGIGLFAFKTVEEAKEAVELVSRDLKTHSESARQIAEAYFDSTKVLNDMINKIYTAQK